MLGRGAGSCALAVTPAWANVLLVAAGMATAIVLATVKWMSGRSSTEGNLARDVGELRTQLHALQRDLKDEPWSTQIVEMGKQLARMEEHFRATDREVIALTNNVEALRQWLAVIKPHV